MILDNDLIRKYFKCDGHECWSDRLDCRERMALRVLAAMEAPIKKGERYLAYHAELGKVLEHENTSTYDWKGWHSNLIRLPDAYQPMRMPSVCSCGCHDRRGAFCCPDMEPLPKTPSPDEKCDCGRASHQGHYYKCSIYKPSSAVEEKIKEIIHEFKWSGTTPGRKIETLRALVKLARETKP